MIDEAESLIDSPTVGLKRCRHGMMMYPLRDPHVGPSLDRYGEYSEAEARLIEQLVEPGTTAVEIGAHVGSLTVPLARRVGPRGRVVALEPQRILFHMLCGNLALNQLAQVDARQAAAGRRVGTVRVAPGDYARGASANMTPLSARDGGEAVALVTVDSLELPVCHFLKINADGMESDVIAGAEETIYRDRPFLYVENERPTQSAALIRRILDLEYRLYWYLSPLFSPDNFFAETRNVFERVVSVNMLGIPAERPQTVSGGREVTGPADRWDFPAQGDDS
ncbi:MAG: FkbM family methyltransferase [Alphaproteobacteria bacterium]